MALITKVQINTEDVLKLARKATDQQLAKAVSRGLNDAIRSGRSTGLTEITKRYNIPRYRVASKGKLKVEGARIGQLTSRLYVSAESVKVASFRGLKGDGISVTKTKIKGSTKTIAKLKRGRKAVPGITRSRPRQKVSVEILRGKRVTFNRAFIARMKSGHVGVFERKKLGSKNYDSSGRFRSRYGKGSRITNRNKSDAPIGSLFSFSIAKGFTNKTNGAKIISKVSKQLPKRVKAWLQMELAKGIR